MVFGGSSSIGRLAATPPNALGEAPWSARVERLDRLNVLVKHLRNRFPEEWSPLFAVLSRRGHIQRRGNLAVARIVAPLLDHEESCGVERSYLEMKPPQLRKFIRAGVVREALLLDRDADIRGAQNKAQGVAIIPRTRLPLTAQLDKIEAALQAQWAAFQRAATAK